MRNNTIPRIEHRRKALHLPRSVGDSVADSVVGTLGTWRYLIVQTLIVCVWLGLNVTAFVRHWDPYPFVALNLLFSTQASYAAPLILMAQNRASARDRARDDVEAQEVASDHVLLEQNTQMVRDIHALLEQNTRLTEACHLLSRQIHAHIAVQSQTQEPESPA